MEFLNQFLNRRVAAFGFDEQLFYGLTLHTNGVLNVARKRRVMRVTVGCVARETPPVNPAADEAERHTQFDLVTFLACGHDRSPHEFGSADDCCPENILFPRFAGTHYLDGDGVRTRVL